VSGAVKLLLILTLLPAQTPVCKVAAVESYTHRTSKPAAPPRCAKCLKKSADSSSSVPAAPKSDRPSQPQPKPVDPSNCLCPLCSAPSAIVPDAFAPAELDQPTAEQLPVSRHLLPPDGFHVLLDRPPRV